MSIIEPGIKYGIMYRMVLSLPLEITLCGVKIYIAYTSDDFILQKKRMKKLSEWK